MDGKRESEQRIAESDFSVSMEVYIATDHYVIVTVSRFVKSCLIKVHLES